MEAILGAPRAWPAGNTRRAARKIIGKAAEALVFFAAKLTNTGVGMFIDWADGTISSPHTEYLGWGTSATTAAITDTGLGTAAAEARVAASRAQATITNTGDTFSYTGTIVSSSAQTIKEVAVFSASTSGTCIVHANHTDAVMSASGDKVDYTVTLQLTN